MRAPIYRTVEDILGPRRRIYYRDPNGYIAVRDERAKLYRWYAYDTDARIYRETGSTARLGAMAHKSTLLRERSPMKPDKKPKPAPVIDANRMVTVTILARHAHGLACHAEQVRMGYRASCGVDGPEALKANLTAEAGYWWETARTLAAAYAASLKPEASQ